MKGQIAANISYWVSASPTAAQAQRYSGAGHSANGLPIGTTGSGPGSPEQPIGKLALRLAYGSASRPKSDGELADSDSKKIPLSNVTEFASESLSGLSCVCRKLKPERSDGEARRGWGVNESFRSDESDEKSAHPCAKTDAF